MGIRASSLSITKFDILIKVCFNCGKVLQKEIPLIINSINFIKYAPLKMYLNHPLVQRIFNISNFNYSNGETVTSNQVYIVGNAEIVYIITISSGVSFVYNYVCKSSYILHFLYFHPYPYY